MDEENKLQKTDEGREVDMVGGEENGDIYLIENRLVDGCFLRCNKNVYEAVRTFMLKHQFEETGEPRFPDEVIIYDKHGVAVKEDTEKIIDSEGDEVEPYVSEEDTAEELLEAVVDDDEDGVAEDTTMVADELIEDEE